jgi:glutathione S-transferase
MTNALDKAVQFVYEPMKRPPEKVHQPFMDGLSTQVAAGLDMLEKLADKSTMPTGEQANLAGITVAVGWRFLHRILPNIASTDRYPALAAHASGCEALSAFSACQPEV